MSSTVPGTTDIGTDWRVLEGVATAWSDAPSLTEGAALVEHAEAVSAAARDLELAADPTVLQQLSVVFESW